MSMIPDKMNGFNSLGDSGNLSKKLKYLAKRILPAVLVPYLKAIYRMLGKIEYGLFTFCEYFGQYEKAMKYRGFRLIYSRGYSLVSRIRRNNVYDPELSQALIDELKRTKSEYFIDIGANIGLVSLNVLSQMPGIKIFCFEPGPHQGSLLEKTIRCNNLGDNVRLFKHSLGDKSGESQFAIHCAVHSSGDGFLDTKRAGKSTLINVGVDTLDNWWKSFGRLLIKVIKIDTEGAELLVLRGAGLFIKECRPAVFLEINETNLKPYPYCAKDLLRYFIEQRYNLRTLDGALIGETNLNYYLKQTDSYVARSAESEG